MAAANDILAVARQELGVKEAPAGSNTVKYNTAYYGRRVAGAAYPWCVAFVWWCFREAGASALFFGGKKTASCSALYAFHKGQAVYGDYRPGDLIFFSFSGKKRTEHIGVCEQYDGVNITTIDGNTGSGNEANGGAVLRRTRAKKYIVAAIRPAYEREEETMTGKEIYEALQGYLAEQPAPAWAQAELQEAVKLGITDGKRPMELVPRYQAAIMALRAAEKYKGE